MFDQTKMTGGVPQGSILEPPLFKTDMFSVPQLFSSVDSSQMCIAVLSSDNSPVDLLSEHIEQITFNMPKCCTIAATQN